MNEASWSVTIQGKATTYNAVSNFYNNLTGSRYFQNVVMGPITAIPAGVSFSLTCQFTPQPQGTGDEAAAAAPAAPAAAGAAPPPHGT
jgi:Tfp pilus assembly protein PilN